MGRSRIAAVVCLTVGAAWSVALVSRAWVRQKTWEEQSSIRTDIRSEEVTPNRALIMGSADATTKIVMFGDYECPPCARAWASVKDAAQKHPKSFAVYFFHFPLTLMHPFALQSALVAEQARDFGKYVPVHEALYSTHLDKQSIDGILNKFRLRPLPPQVDQASRDRVKTDIALGTKIGVDATPTLLVVDRNSQVFELNSYLALRTWE